MANPITTGFRGLLDTGMLGDIGTGLLASSGYSPTPISLGQAFGGAMQYANQREVQKLEMSQLRNKIAQDQQRQKAMTQLQGLMQPGMTPGPVMVPTPPAIQTPDGRQQMIGLLGQIAPEAVAQGLLAAEFKAQEPERVSTDLTTFKALYPNLQQGTPQFADAFLKFTAQKDTTGGLMDEARLELTLAELQAAREERQLAQETKSQERATTRRSIMTDLSHLSEMAEINKRLEGTALETGLPMADLRRAAAGGMEALQSVLGKNTRKLAQIKQDFDTFNKYSTDFVVGSLDRLQGGGAITQGKFDALIKSNANIGASPGTNNLIIANNLEALIDGAEIGGYELPADMVSEYRSLAAQLRQESEPESDNPPASNLLDAPPAEDSGQIQQLQNQLNQLEAVIRSLGG